MLRGHCCCLVLVSASASAVLVSLLLCNISSLSAAILCKHAFLSLCLLLDNLSSHCSIVFRSVAVCGFYRSLSFCVLAPLAACRSFAIDSFYHSLSFFAIAEPAVVNTYCYNFLPLPLSLIHIHRYHHNRALTLCVYRHCNGELHTYAVPMECSKLRISVTFEWGSLRLAPINRQVRFSSNVICRCVTKQ